MQNNGENVYRFYLPCQLQQCCSASGVRGISHRGTVERTARKILGKLKFLDGHAISLELGKVQHITGDG